MGISFSQLLFSVHGVSFTEDGLSVLKGIECKGIIQKSRLEMEWKQIHLCSDPFSCETLIEGIVDIIPLMRNPRRQTNQEINLVIHIGELDFLFSHSLLTLTNSFWNQQSLSVDSVMLTTNDQLILLIQALGFEKHRVGIPVAEIYYSPLSFDSTIQSVCSILPMIPKRWRLSIDWHLLANSKNWIHGPRMVSYRSPPFMTHLLNKAQYQFMMDVKQCKLFISIDSLQSSIGSKRPSNISSQSFPTTLLLQTHLLVFMSSKRDPSWGIEFLNSMLYESGQLLLLVTRGSLIGNAQHCLDISFSHIRVTITPSQLISVIRMAQEITFSVWCTLFDLWATLRTGCFQSARLFNSSSTDHSARQGTIQPPNSRRNRIYSDQHEYEHIRDYFWSTVSSDGSELDRMECLDTEVMIHSGSWSITVDVKRWGSYYMPAIDFFFEGISVQTTGLCLQTECLTFQETIFSDSLFEGCEGELLKSKSVFGVLTLEYLLRSKYCGHSIECRKEIEI